MLQLPQRMSQFALYKKILCVNQRVFVLSIAIAETIASHFVLFLLCLASIQECKVGKVLFDYAMDQMEREEYYETPKYHGRSIDEIRFNDARKLMNYRLISLYTATACVGVYALCTLCLLIGAMKRRHELMLPWLLIHAMSSFVLAAGGISIYFSEQFPRFFNVYTVGLGIVGMICDMFMWYVVYNYYETLKMMKNLTEEAVVSIPCPSVPLQFRKENMYLGSNGYKHLVSEISNPNYVV